MTAAVCVDLDGTLVRYERSFDAVVAATLTDTVVRNQFRQCR